MTVTAALDESYVIEDPSDVITPSLAIYPDLITPHVEAAIRTAGGPLRMRPHVKTHKTVEIARMLLEAGVTKHKCATIPEAELLARAGVDDIVLAYPLVGPNIGRFARLQQLYPACSFKPLVDHAAPMAALGAEMVAQGQTAEVLLDLDVGLGRTGVAPGPEAAELYRRIGATAGLKQGGLHAYDGHNHQSDPAERMAAVQAGWDQMRALIEDLEADGQSIPRLVCGTSPSFPCWAEIGRGDDRIECSPGTLFINDWNFYRLFEDIPLRPAAVLLSRVVSKPVPGRLTLDLGHKAVAADSPMERRVKFLNIPDAKILLQNEEHLVVETALADDFAPGDLVYAWPAHICPTCALHKELLVVENHRVTGAWSVIGRDRKLEC